MRGITFIALVLFAGQGVLAHGGHTAVYSYQIEAESILLEFRIESSVLQHFDLKSKCEAYETATAWCLAQYIEANSSLRINEEVVRFELVSSRKDEDFFIISMRATGDFSNSAHIQLNNECFLEYDFSFTAQVME